jgi:hypothetical protein
MFMADDYHIEQADMPFLISRFFYLVTLEKHFCLAICTQVSQLKKR